MKKITKIIAMTTDPFDNIYGYSLIFLQLFDYIARTNPTVQVEIFSNGGRSSAALATHTIKPLSLNPDASMPIKAFTLVRKFIQSILPSPRGTVIVANSEFPELIALCILKIKFKHVYCFAHDYETGFRKLGLVYHLIRKILIKRIGRVIVLNELHKNKIEADIKGVKCYVIPNPIFLDA